jgi:catalase
MCGTRTAAWSVSPTTETGSRPRALGLVDQVGTLEGLATARARGRKGGRPSKLTLHAEDDDYGQANTLVNEVMDDAARARLVSNVSGALAGIVSDDIRERAVQYWKNIDKKTGDKIEQAVRDARG